MKKILAALMLLLIVGFNCVLSACSLVTINNTKYLKQTVASTDGVKINMEDLILGYNSFGYNYVQSYGMTNEEAVKQTLEDLIDRELVFNYAKQEIGELSITQQNEVLRNVFESINSQIKEYADEIIKSENLELPETSEPEEEAKTVTQTTTYVKTVTRTKNQDGSYNYSRVTEDKTEDTKLIEFSLDEYGIEGLNERAYSKYLNATRKSRDEYKKLTNEQIFEKEKDRLYKIYEKNVYISIFQENFESEMEINLDAIKEKYIELVRNSAFTYALNESSYNTKMQSSSKDVYYQPFGDKYIEVAHILIKYSEEQENEIKDLKAKLKDGGIDIEEYNQQIKDLSGAIRAKERVDGVEVGEDKTVNEIYNEILASLNSCGNDNNLRVKTFIEYIDKYNDDEGMVSAINSQSQYYAVNLDTSVEDTMVKEFADASRALYSADGSTDYTLYSTPVLTEYGYHIIFSLGAVKNDISLSNIDNVSISYLYETEIMEGTNKSIFDAMLELVDVSEFNTYQTSLVKGLRSGKTIKFNKTAYERLYK